MNRPLLNTKYQKEFLTKNEAIEYACNSGHKYIIEAPKYLLDNNNKEVTYYVCYYRPELGRGERIIK